MLADYLDVALLCIGVLCIILGIAGCILPILPGPPLSYIGILLLHATQWVQFSTLFLIVWACIVITITTLDYYIPIWTTKRFGASKKGTIGSLIGMIVGIFVLPPWGLIIFPIIGTIIGELLNRNKVSSSVKISLGSFVGFLFATLIKLIVSVVLAFYFFKAIYADLIKDLI